MVSDETYEICLPLLQDTTLDDEERIDKLEELLRKETILVGSRLENAVLDVLWLYRESLTNTASPPPLRHTVLRVPSPPPWQILRGGADTPVSPSPQLGVSPLSPPGFVRQSFNRNKSSTASLFLSPRPPPRLASSGLAIPSGPSLNDYEFPTDISPIQDIYGDYGSENVDWLVEDNGGSNTPSSAGGQSGRNAKAAEYIQPQQSDMSPYDMLRQILGPSKSDEEIEAALAMHGYDLSATIMALMEGQGADGATAQAQATEAKNAILIGKSITAEVPRPITPASQQRSGIICRFWLSTGQCLKADCRFSHDLSNHICKYWVMGNCLAGDTCIFSHDPSHFMNRLALDESNTPPLQNAQPGFQFQDYNAFPSLQSMKDQGPSPYSSANAFSNYQGASVTPPPGFKGMQGYASNGSSQGSRPSSRHQTRESMPSAPSLDDTEAIPSPRHVPWLETGERANKAYLKARHDAIKHGGLRNKFLQSAAQAWNRNDAYAAKALSLRGQSENDAMRKAHREAARELYKERNKNSSSSSELYVDLHGLHPEEAVEYLKKVLLENQKEMRPVYAITGTGYHSKNGKDKAGKAIRNFLNKWRYAYREFSVPGDRHNVGGILGIDARSCDKTLSRDGVSGAEKEAEKEEVDILSQGHEIGQGKVRFLVRDTPDTTENIFEEVLPTSSPTIADRMGPDIPESIPGLDSDDGMGSEQIEDAGEPPPPKRILSSQALRALSRSPLVDDGTHGLVQSHLKSSFNPDVHSDSGYGSSIRNGSLSNAMSSIGDRHSSLEWPNENQSEGEFRDEETDSKSARVDVLQPPKPALDDDLRSVVSDLDDINSQVSTKKSPQEILAERHLVALLAQNEELRPLYEEALKRVGEGRFVNNLRKLLKRFYLDLSLHAKTNLEKATIHLLRGHRSRIRLAQQMVEHLSPENQEDARLRTSDICWQTEDLEAWIASNSGLASHQAPPVEDNREEISDFNELVDDSSDDEDDERSTTLPNIAEMEKFLLGGNSFRNLSINLREFLLPASLTPLTRVLMSIPRDRIWFSDKEDISFINKLKTKLEEATDENWNWWPLRPRMKLLQKNQIRVHWLCHCGTHMWAEVSNSHAETYKLLLQRDTVAMVNNHLCRSRLENTRGIKAAILAWITGTPSLTTVPAGSNASLGGATQQTSQGIPLGHQHGDGQPNSTMPAPNAVAINQPGIQLSLTTGSVNELFVLFGVQGGRRTLELAQINVSTNTDDGVFFRDLRDKYRELRGFWRYWLSVWQMRYCDFVKFKKVDADRIIFHKMDLPDDILYEYTPRPPDAEIPPILPHEFEFALMFCSTGCLFGRLPFFHDCVRPRSGRFALDRIPKRKAALELRISTIEPAWGIQAQFSISAALVFFYHLLILAGAFGFWAWWQAHHPGDLQNATVPLSVIAVFLSLFWSSTGVLKGFRVPDP